MRAKICRHEEIYLFGGHAMAPCIASGGHKKAQYTAHPPVPQRESQSTRSARSSSPTNALTDAKIQDSRTTSFRPSPVKLPWNGLAVFLPPPLQQPLFQQHHMQSTLPLHRQGQTTSQRTRPNSLPRPSVCASMPRMWPVVWSFGAS